MTRLLLAFLLLPWADGGADEQALRDAGVGTDGPALLQYFRSRTVNDADRAKVEALIRRLSAEEFKDREKASQDLVRLGPVAEPLLRKAAEDPDPEVKRRAEECLNRLAAGSSPSLLAAAARVLAARKPAGAVEVLLAYAPFAPDDLVADEVRSALAAVALRDGKPDPILTAALTDKTPARRAAAGVALARVSPAEVRRLLQDTDVGVRLRVALAFAVAGERAAVPVLIASVTEARAEDAVRAEDLLVALAGADAPAAAFGRDRDRSRAAWADWWKANGDKADLSRLKDGGSALGYTLVVQRDATGTVGRVMELDRTGRVRWQIEGLRSPVDAQLLPGGRVLISEYTGHRITERNQQGEVLWEKTVTGMLLSARRQPDGTTFVVTRNGLTLLDRDGKEKPFHPRPTPDVYAARRLPNGETVLVTTAGTCVRLDAAGKEVSTFRCGRLALYGGIDVLPGGNLLMPIATENRVVEYDAAGKVVWEASTQYPVSATRLRNGNTLVSSTTGRYVAEFDREGKEVRRFTTEGRPYKAYRR